MSLILWIQKYLVLLHKIGIVQFIKLIIKEALCPSSCSREASETYSSMQEVGLTVSAS